MIVKCEKCGNNFNKFPSRINPNGHNYCKECLPAPKPKQPKKTVECNYCHNSFKKAVGRIGKLNFCCKECYNKYNGEKSQIKCDKCGEYFHRPYCDYKKNKHNYCTNCSEKSKYSPNKIKKIKVECDCCHIIFEKAPSELRDKNYCSRGCRSKGQEKRVIIKCLNCNAAREVRQCEVGKIKYCSNECGIEYRKKQTKTKRKRSYIHTHCHYCGDNIERKSYDINRSKYHFCNKECYDKWQANKIIVKCNYCKKDIETTPYFLKKNKHFYCNTECYRNSQPKPKLYHCKFCNKEFWQYESRGCEFCSKECYSKFMTQDNVECGFCGKSFHRVESQVKEDNYCSVECRGESQKTGKVVNCDNCGNSFYRKLYQLKEHNFCSNECRITFFKGKNCHNYILNRGNVNKARKFRWSKEVQQWRTNVFERDKYTCVLCGTKGNRLNAHHIIKYAEDMKNNNVSNCFDVSNGVTLCESPCHREMHSKEEYYAPLFQKIIELKKQNIQPSQEEINQELILIREKINQDKENRLKEKV